MLEASQPNPDPQPPVGAVVKIQGKRKTARGADMPRRRQRTIRFSEPVWLRLDKEAELDGITPAELLRRIVDVHFVRDHLIADLKMRLQSLESRLSRLESMEQ